MGKRSMRTTTASRRGAFAEGAGAGASVLIGDCGLMRSRDVARGRPGGSSASTLRSFMGCLSPPISRRRGLRPPPTLVHQKTRVISATCLLISSNNPLKPPIFFETRLAGAPRGPRQSVRALHHRDEEAVSAVIARRHQQRLVRSVGGGHRRLARKRSLPQLGPRDGLELGMAGEKALHLVA